MIKIFNFKIVKSGKEIEVYHYLTKNVVRGYKRKERKINKTKKEKKNNLSYGTWSIDEIVVELDRQEEAKKAEEKQKTEFSVQRTKKSIKRLANANQQLDKFLTLTFAESTTDLKEANKLFHLAMKRIMHKHKDFAYIAVVEYQKDVDYYGRKKEKGGSVHYHLLCNIKTIIKRDRFEWERWFKNRYWKYGFVKVKDITTVNNMGSYLCKYLSKEMFDKRMFNKKKFFCSKNLHQPQEIIGAKAEIFFEKFVKHLTPKFESVNENEWAGKVKYSLYTLEHDLIIKPQSDNI